MIYLLIDNLTLVDDTRRAVHDVCAGDVILAGTIPIYNRVLGMLSREKPEMLVYVRMVNGDYFPAVGIEAYYGPDDDPVLYNPFEDGHGL